MGWGGRWERVSEWGTHVHPWLIHVNVWQNHYNIVISLQLKEIKKKNFPQFAVIPTVKGLGILNKAEIDVFLELSCFFDGPVDVGNLISGSSAFCKSSLNIWNFTVNIWLKPGLENFEHYFASL